MAGKNWYLYSMMNHSNVRFIHLHDINFQAKGIINSRDDLILSKVRYTIERTRKTDPESESLNIFNVKFDGE